MQNCLGITLASYQGNLNLTTDTKCHLSHRQFESVGLCLHQLFSSYSLSFLLYNKTKFCFISVRWPCHGSGGLSSASRRRAPGLIPGLSMWNLWWKKLHRDRIYSRVLRFPHVSIIPSMLHSYYLHT